MRTEVRGDRRAVIQAPGVALRAGEFATPPGWEPDCQSSPAEARVPEALGSAAAQDWLGENEARGGAGDNTPSWCRATSNGEGQHAIKDRPGMALRPRGPRHQSEKGRSTLVAWC